MRCGDRNYHWFGAHSVPVGIREEKQHVMVSQVLRIEMLFSIQPAASAQKQATAC